LSQAPKITPPTPTVTGGGDSLPGGSSPRGTRSVPAGSGSNPNSSSITYENPNPPPSATKIEGRTFSENRFNNPSSSEPNRAPIVIISQQPAQTNNPQGTTGTGANGVASAPNSAASTPASNGIALNTTANTSAVPAGSKTRPPQTTSGGSNGGPGFFDSSNNLAGVEPNKPDPEALIKAKNKAWALRAATQNLSLTEGATTEDASAGTKDASTKSAETTKSAIAKSDSIKGLNTKTYDPGFALLASTALPSGPSDLDSFRASVKNGSQSMIGRGFMGRKKGFPLGSNGTTAAKKASSTRALASTSDADNSTFTATLKKIGISARGFMIKIGKFFGFT